MKTKNQIIGILVSRGWNETMLREFPKKYLDAIEAQKSYACRREEESG